MWERLLGEWSDVRVPMLEWAALWLRDHAPPAPRVSIVHGDYRIGNFLVEDGAHHGDSRLGAGAPRRSRRRSRLDLHAGVARPLAATCVICSTASELLDDYNALTGFDMSRARGALLGGVRRSTSSR